MCIGMTSFGVGLFVFALLAAFLGWIRIVSAKTSQSEPSDASPLTVGMSLLFLIVLIAALWAWIKFMIPFIDFLVSQPEMASPELGSIRTAILVFQLAIKAVVPFFGMLIGASLRNLAVAVYPKFSNLRPRVLVALVAGTVAAVAVLLSEDEGQALNVPAILAVPLGEVPVVPSVTVLLELVMLIAALLILFKAARRFSQSALPKYDTQVRIWMIYAFLGLLFALGISASYRIATSTSTAWHVLPLSVALMLPLPLAVVAYAKLKRSITARCYSVSGLEGSRWRQLVEVIETECDERGLRVPEVLVAAPFTSPQVAGSATRAYLMFPKNYHDIIAALATRVGNRAAAALHRFVILHEISHLEYIDYRMSTWLGHFLGASIRVWYPLYLVAVVVMVVVHDDWSYTGRIGSAFMLVVAVGSLLGLLSVLSLAVSRDRELLADRRAFDACTPDERAAILGRTIALGADVLSPLEILMRMFPVRQSGREGAGLVGGDSSSMVKHGVHTVRGALGRVMTVLVAHPASGARVSSLTSESDPLFMREGDSENGVFAGVAAGLAVVVWGVMTATLGLWPPDPYANAAFFVTGVAVVGILSATLFMPLKHARRFVKDFKDYDKAVRRKLVFATVASGVVVTLNMLPIVSLQGINATVYVALMFGLSAYLIVMVAVALSIERGSDVFPESDLWQVMGRVMVTVVVMVFLGG